MTPSSALWLAGFCREKPISGGRARDGVFAFAADLAANGAIRGCRFATSSHELRPRRVRNCAAGAHLAALCPAASEHGGQTPSPVRLMVQDRAHWAVGQRQIREPSQRSASRVYLSDWSAQYLFGVVFSSSRAGILSWGSPTSTRPPQSCKSRVQIEPQHRGQWGESVLANAFFLRPVVSLYHESSH